MFTYYTDSKIATMDTKPNRLHHRRRIVDRTPGQPQPAQLVDPLGDRHLAIIAYIRCLESAAFRMQPIRINVSDAVEWPPSTRTSWVAWSSSRSSTIAGADRRCM